MNRIQLRRKLAGGYNVVLGLGLLIAVAVPAVKAVEDAQIGPKDSNVWNALVWTQANAWWILPALIVIGAAIGWFRRSIGPPWVWDAIHSYLDVFRDNWFNETEGAEYNRVTLFKHVRWRFCFVRWPWDGWLIPVERSGYTTQLTKIAFRAPDDPTRAQGVAGLTWAKNRSIRVNELPALTRASSAQDFADYGQSTGVEGKWMEARVMKTAPISRSFYAFPIEAKNKPWGVIVLDSKDPGGIKEDPNPSFAIMGRLLQKLVERV